MQKHINKHHSDGHSVKVSHLSIMPSLGNLVHSSMYKDHIQFIAAQPDVDFTQQDEHAIDVQNHHYPMNNFPLPQIDEKKYQIKYNVQLTPSMLYQIDLEHTLRRHRNVDLSLHDEINEVMERHASRGVKLSESKVYKRERLVEELTMAFNLYESKPTIIRVPISRNTSLASVAIFNVEARLLSILHNANLMQEGNFAKDYDVFTGKPTQEITHYDEVHTGKQFEIARAHWCKDDPDVFPLPLVAFYDKTHVDVFGSLSCSPFIVWPAFFNKDFRCQQAYSRVLGYVPNLGYGKGKTNRQPSTVKLQDEHNCLRQVTKQLIFIMQKGGIHTTIMGRKVRVMPWLHIITGDNSGHNDLVGHYNGGGKTGHPFRDCKCSFEDLDDPDPQCELVDTEYIEHAKTITGGLKAISKHNIVNCLMNVPMSDLRGGGLGNTPSEMLHVCGTGIIKYLLQSACDIVGEKKIQKGKRQ